MTEEGLSPIVKVIAAMLFPFILIYSLYVILHGHLTPGGGFQGGAIGASAVVLLVAAFGSGYVQRKADKDAISLFESIGGLVFVVTGLLGLALATTFLSNFLVGEALFGEIPSWGPGTGILNSGGILPILNLAVGMKVISGLASVVLIMALATKKEELA